MDFIGKRRIWYVLSLLVILAGLVSFVVQGLNFGIDFTGGTLLHLQFENGNVNDAGIRSALQEYGLEKSSIQYSDGSFIIRTQELDQEKTEQVFQGLESKLGKFTVLRSENVGPVIGDELARKGLLALLVASILQVLYITVRFEFKFAIAAIIALLHDTIITIGFFSLLQYEVSLTFLAAVLTILGYSINDTIVIFDRIRENLQNRRKEELADLVNRSIKQNLVRSITTSLTVLFILLALLLLGGETTKYFALAMLVGVVAGAYSSIFIASSLWFDFNPTKTKTAKA